MTSFNMSLEKALKILEANGMNAQAGFVCEAFIKPKADISEGDLAAKIYERCAFSEDHMRIRKHAANYIAAFYAKQDLPLNGMVMWGSRDLKKFAVLLAAGKSLDSACASLRSIMAVTPQETAGEIEQAKNRIKKERRAAEEERRKAYLASDEYKHSQDPGWRGPHGAWTTD